MFEECIILLLSFGLFYSWFFFKQKQKQHNEHDEWLQGRRSHLKAIRHRFERECNNIVCEFIETKYQDMQVMLCETVMSLPFVMERVDRLFSDYARYIHKASDWIEVYGLNQMLDALSTYDWISH